MGFLVDTSVFVAWERKRLDPASILTEIADEPVALAAISASELLHGVHRADSAQRRGRRLALVEAILASVPVLPFDLEVARAHAQIWADLARAGTPIGAHDAQIAATAVTHGLKIAMRNEREFARVEALELVFW